MRSPIINQHNLPLVLAAALLLVALPLLSVFAIQPAAESSQIRLQYASFDPLKAEPRLPAPLQMQVEAGKPAMMLVQFNGPVQQAWKEAVKAAGAPLYDYIPEHTFLTRIDGETAQALRRLPFVRWVGAYHPAYRLPASLSEKAANAIEAGGESLELQAAILPDADLDNLAAQVEALGGSLQSQSSDDLAGYLRLSLPASQVYSLAALDGVVWVQTYQPRQLLNDIGEGIMSIPAVRTSLGLYGANQVVAIADSGLDVGTTGAAMSDDFEGRIISGSSLCPPFTGRTDWNDFGGHGTHVSGSALGNGALSGGQFAGVAPQARLVFQAVDDPSTDYLECIPDTLYADLFQPAYNLNTRIHSDSWGGPSGDPPNPYGGYDLQAREVDWAAWNLKNLLILYAAGNSGADADYDGRVDSDSILSPATAKNVVTVGATENNRPNFTQYNWGDNFSFFAEPIASDLLADNATGMAAFSSRGPTDDGRIKPDIVAPGTFILSARSHDPAAGTGWLSYNEHYTYNGGTSMATPLTAGSAALVREWLTKLRGFSNPSAALMKAALLNGAADISPGQYTSPQEIPNQRPNNVSGWGRVDLKASLNPPAPRQIWLVDNTSGLTDSGKTITYTLKVGGLSAQAEQNSLSLEVSPAQEAVPAAEATPQPPSAAPRKVELALSGMGQEAGSRQTSPLAPAANVTLALDDGSYEDSMGLVDTGAGVSFQFIWFNRFTPNPGDIPFNLEQIQVLFDGTAGVPQGGDIDLVVYQDADGNPANGATLLRVIPETVKAIDGSWSVYNLATPLAITSPGDVLIAVINRYVVDGVSPISYPATIDQNSDQLRSWVGWWVAEPPDPPQLPTDDTLALIGTLASGGNWMIRGFGTTTAAPPTPSQTPSPTPGTPAPTPTATPPPVAGGPLRLTLAWTDYPGAIAAGKALVNDLDLEVVAPDGVHYYGNAGLYTAGQCLRQQSSTVKWDACNNVEGVYIPNAKYGTYTVYVHGYEIANGPQPFALIASGDYLLTSSLNKRIYLPMVRK